MYVYRICCLWRINDETEQQACSPWALGTGSDVHADLSPPRTNPEHASYDMIRVWVAGETV